MLGVFVFSNFTLYIKVLNKPIHTNTNKEWFANWFNSPNYHQLYNNRDESEADFFITNLTAHLKLKAGSAVWDLACGKGRHSVKLNQLGYEVVGTDLAENSIAEANKCANATLDFFVHDMRTPFRIHAFDAVFNLFTSIGYFENEKDNLKVFETVNAALKNEGLFVIDFFNAKRVKSCLIENTEVNRDGVIYNIHKSIKNRQIIKCISFLADQKEMYFEEKVFLYEKEDFVAFADKTGFELRECFGDYSLKPFNEQTSDRLILIFKKKK